MLVADWIILRLFAQTIMVVSPEYLQKVRLRSDDTEQTVL